MGFLDNSSITVDAILTKRGREILAAGGDLNITKFALSDEEIDYTLYDVTHPNGTDSYGAVIENMSLLEATPNRTTFRSFLVNESQAGATLNVDSTNYANVDNGTDIALSPTTVGSPAENYIFTIGKQGIATQRYKGLGEMNPDQLWETTLDPESRSLQQVKISDGTEVRDVFNKLMGESVDERRTFIQKNALKVANLDI